MKQYDSVLAMLCVSSCNMCVLAMQNVCYSVLGRCKQFVRSKKQYVCASKCLCVKVSCRKIVFVFVI